MPLQQPGLAARALRRAAKRCEQYGELGGDAMTLLSGDVRAGRARGPVRRRRLQAWQIQN